MATLTPDGKKIVLKYLFKAEFEDGTCILQNEGDQSTIDASRSSFYDVLKEQEKGKKLVKFTLQGNGHACAVDLTDGHFEANGVAFFLHEKVEMEEFRIMYFRVRDNHFTNGEFVGGDTAYRIGWQANQKITGENEQHFIEIN